MAVVALSLLVYQSTHEPLAVTGVYLTAEFVPAFIAPVVVARVDHYDARRLLTALYVLEGAFFAGLALVSTAFSLSAVLVITLADGILLLVAKGVLRSAIHEVLEPEGTLRQGNALLNVAFATFLVGGSLLSGLLVSAVDPWLPLTVNAASFLVAAAVLASAPVAPAKPVSREPFWIASEQGSTS